MIVSSTVRSASCNVQGDANKSAPRYTCPAQGRRGCHRAHRRQRSGTVSEQGAITLWDVGKEDVTRAEKLTVLEWYANRVQLLAFTADGKTLASGSEDCTVKLWQ